ncbi:MAG TPA: hypothetical protein VIY28_08925 [Pseudonocardiaceae bacterium]
MDVVADIVVFVLSHTFAAVTGMAPPNGWGALLAIAIGLSLVAAKVLIIGYDRRKTYTAILNQTRQATRYCAVNRVPHLVDDILSDAVEVLVKKLAEKIDLGAR